MANQEAEKSRRPSWKVVLSALGVVFLIMTATLILSALLVTPGPSPVILGY
ncbi:MAG: hypothetical protein HY913_05450 [Desulfomonile tiedjei]|nr:hypothetical protein [Desulfomonile tiedjei]